jgi:hypothetical protein
MRQMGNAISLIIVLIDMIAFLLLITVHTVVFQWDDIRTCNLEALAEQVNNASEERLAQVMPHVFDVFHRTCDAAGTGADAGGRPFKPELPTLVMHPLMAERLRSLPPITPAQQKALDELIERKRTEFNARRRHRKLH